MEEDNKLTLGNDSSLNSSGLALEKKLVDIILPILRSYQIKGYDTIQILEILDLATDRAKAIALDQK